MAKLIYSEQALVDLERLSDFLVETDLPAAEETVNLITDAVMILERHPYIGRPAAGLLRELFISQGNSGYLVLSICEEIHDIILILAVRHQREMGYVGDSPS